MATIFSHPAVAIGLFPWFSSVRASKAIILTGLLLTALPDIDVIGFYLGIPYHHMLGHRGITHSVFFAAAFSGLLAWMFAQKQQIKAGAVWLYLFLSMASHGFIDALTNGGLGIAFLAPFSNHRYFFPFHPIEVSTLNIKHFFEGQGAAVLLNELAYIWPICLLVMLAGFLWKRQKSAG